MSKFPIVLMVAFAAFDSALFGVVFGSFLAASLAFLASISMIYWAVTKQ